MNFVQFNTNYWRSEELDTLDRDEKLFFTYLNSNPNINQVGIFDFSFKWTGIELGMELAELNNHIISLQTKGLIEYSADTGEMLIPSFFKRHILDIRSKYDIRSRTNALRLLCKVRDRELIWLISDIDKIGTREQIEAVISFEPSEITTALIEKVWGI